MAYAYLKNLQGDIVAILNGSGSAVVSYVYDAWGRPVSKTGSMASTLGTLNPFRYRSYVYDEETGLYYLRSRYYNPTCCRFINMDSVLLKGLLMSNQQAYCCNGPVQRTDSNGRNFVEDIWNLFCETVNANQEIAQQNAQAEIEAWQTVGGAIVDAASTVWDLYVDSVNETQRIQMENARLQYEAMKALGSWFSNGFNELCTALLEGLKAQQAADIISAQQQYTAASRIVGWANENWTTLSDIWFASSTLAGIGEVLGLWVLPKPVSLAICVIDIVMFAGDKAND